MALPNKYLFQCRPIMIEKTDILQNVDIDFTFPTIKAAIWKTYDWNKLGPNTIFSHVIDKRFYSWQIHHEKLVQYQQIWKDKKKFHYEMERAISLYVSVHATMIEQAISKIILNETGKTTMNKEYVQMYLMTAFYELKHYGQVAAGDTIAIQTAATFRGNVKDALEFICNFYAPNHSIEPNKWLYFWFEMFAEYILTSICS